MRSYDTSPICRIDWRASRWLVSALIALGVLAAASLSLSDLPSPWHWPAGAACIACGLWLAWRESRRPALRVAWSGGDGSTRVEGAGPAATWSHVHASVRGPMAVLRGRDAYGRTRRLVWWPDTLDAGARRQLRLASQVSRHSGKPLRRMAA